MRNVFALVEAQLLLLPLLIFVGGPVAYNPVLAFPTGTTPYTGSTNNEIAATGSPSNNETLLSSSATDTTGGLTEYPVFISVPEDESQTFSPALLSSDSLSSSSSVVLADGESESNSDSNSNPDADPAVTEGYMVIEDQEVDEEEDDGSDSDSSTVSSAIVRTTLPMQSPKSSREQEEVLRELKKLWDLSEGLNGSGAEDNTGLKNSLSSIVYLAYARVYSESDETLLKLKYLLQKLQARILGTEANVDESFSTAVPPSSSISSFSSTPYEVLTSEPNYSSSDTTTNATSSPRNLMTGVTITSSDTETRGGKLLERKRRSYDEDIEAIFFANVNSDENSVIPDEKNQLNKIMKNQSSDGNDIQKNGQEEMSQKHGIVKDSMMSQLKNGSDGRKETPLLDRTLLQVGTVSSTTSSSTTLVSISKLATVEMATTPTPSTLVQKVVHINDRRKPMPSFYLSPERIKELKDMMKKSTTTSRPPLLATRSTTTITTLSPISIAIEDDVENEVNSLQQQGQVENYDVHISENFPPALSTTTSSPLLSNEKKKPGLTTMPSLSSMVTATGSPYTAEEIALALFQLLRPDALDDNNEIESHNEVVKVTAQQVRPPTPSTILYQVGSLSSVLNYNLSKPLDGTITSAPLTSTTTALSSSTSSTTTSTAKTTTSMPTSTTTTKAKPPPTLPASILSVLKLKDTFLKKNSTLLLDLPSELSNLDLALTTTPRPRSTTTTERQNVYQNNDDNYPDYNDPMPSTPSPTLLDGIRDTILQTLVALTRLSIGAKVVLLFSLSISVLSIGFGLYALGPPLAGVGFLGIIIPMGLLLLFETTAMPNKKVDMRKRQEELIEKVQSEEFSKILDSIFDAVIKYGKGERKFQLK